MYTELSTVKREIRVLHIHPASNSTDTIECTLTTVSLQETTIYDALSYVWGDPTITETIWVNGQNFQATRNLVAGLKQIRESSQPNPIWVDAICINQRNVEEKNEQVPLMRDIYRGAQVTLVWLGDAGENSRLAFQLLERWYSAYKNSVKLMRENKNVPEGLMKVGRTIGTSKPDDRDGFAKPGKLFKETTRDHTAEIMLSKYDRKEFDALLNFLILPYWARVWITQEFALSRDLVFLWGKHKISYNKLSIGYIALQNFDSLYGLGDVLSAEHLKRLGMCSSRRLGTLIDLKGRYADPNKVRFLSLYELIILNREGVATHTLDKVYSLLGLCEQHVAVDYSRPANEFFQYLTENFLKDSLVGTNILCLTVGSVQAPEGSARPSWVPDYAAPNSFFNKNREFYDWKDSGLSADAVVTHNQLEVSCIFSTRQVRDVRHYTPDKPTPLTDLQTWLKFALSGPKFHPSGLPNLQVFFRTLTQDDSWHGIGKSKFESEFQEMFFCRAAASFMALLPSLLPPDAPMDEKPVHDSRSSFNPVERDSCRNQKGFLGPAEYQALKEEQNVPYAVVGLYCWLAKSALEPETMTMTTVLEEFFGKQDSTVHVQMPKSDKYLTTAGPQEFFAGTVIPSRLRGDSFFMTDDGYMGLGPRGVEPGDKICSVPGCRYPLVVRRRRYETVGDGSDDGKEYFRVVGPCYVYGMMHGEAARDTDVREKIRRVVFV